jgi:hypothetical protein
MVNYSILTTEEVAMALERSIERVDGKPRLKSPIVEVVDGGAIYIGDMAESLKNEAEGPPPATLLAALDLPADATYVDVARVIDMLGAPHVPGLEAELEREFAKFNLETGGDTAGNA